MRTLITLIILLTFTCGCLKRNEFSQFPEINYQLESAIDQNTGLYISRGIVNSKSIDSLVINVIKLDKNVIQLSSDAFGAISIPVNNLTQYDGYAMPGGSGSDLVSSNSAIQFSIVNANMVLKYQKSTTILDLAAKKTQ
jgi:hypothetical protein